MSESYKTQDLLDFLVLTQHTKSISKELNAIPKESTA